MVYRRLHQFINICDLECGRKLPTTEFYHLVLFFKVVCTDFENCGSEIQVYICVVIHKLYGYINHHLSIVNTFPLPHINHVYFNYHQWDKTRKIRCKVKYDWGINGCCNFIVPIIIVPTPLYQTSGQYMSLLLM